MDFSIPFNKAWKVFQKNSIDLVIGYILMLVVSGLTFGLLAPGVYFGYKLMILKALRGKQVTPTDIFAGLKQYWNIVGLCFYTGFILFWLVITFIGILPAMLIGTWWMYAGLFIVDKNYSITKAMSASKKIVRKNNVWLHWIFLLIIAFVGGLGCSLAGIGALITMPFALTAFCAAYEQENKK